MSHALQVRFVRLDPREDLITLAATHYKQMRRVLDAPGECAVCLERRDARVHALVKLSERGATRAEARASHLDAEVALGRALNRLREQLTARTPFIAPIWRETAELA